MGKLFLGISCFIIGFCPLIFAKEPAALVIEIAQLTDELFPPGEEMFAFKDDRIYLDKALWPQTEGTERAKNLYVEDGLKYLEDTSRIILFRSKDNNFIWLAKKKLPSPSLLAKTIRTPLPFKGWKINPDYSLSIYQERGSKKVSLQESLCLSQTKSACSLYLYNYGIKAIEPGRLKVQETPMEIDDSFSGHFFGPGDYNKFEISLPQPGNLVVEFHSSAGPGSIDIAIYNEKGGKIGEGGASFKELSTARIKLTYRGIGEADYSAGFLFSPDSPLACDIGIKNKNKDDIYEVTLTLKNRGSMPVEILKLDTGTVSWYAKGELIAAAHPSRLPQEELLEPDEELIYQQQFLFPEGIKNIEARIDLPNKPQGLRCRAEF